MHIEHIRSAREALDREILKLFREFKDKTGLAVVGCTVEVVPDSRSGAHTAGAAVRLEQV